MTHPHSLLHHGRYTPFWIQDFYDQAGIWWGADPRHQASMRPDCNRGAPLRARAQRILDLGAGPGATAAALADAGHTVVAVELSPQRAAFAHTLAESPRAGSLTVLEADFYTVALDGPFDVVCCWEVFGLGTDADQRRLLRRIAQDGFSRTAACWWMFTTPPARLATPARQNGWRPSPACPARWRWERCHFDPVHCRWIDEWEPAAPEQALAQAIRCYTPQTCCCCSKEPGWRCATSRWMAKPWTRPVTASQLPGR